jgi:hypothetical protein
MASKYIVMPFGKHKGEFIDEIETGYLSWVLSNCSNLNAYLRNAIEEELDDRRDTPDDPEHHLPDLTGILGKVRRELAMQYHPDRGGDAGIMRGVNIALDRVQQLVEVA